MFAAYVLREPRRFCSARAAVARKFCDRFALVAHQNRAIFVPNVCFHTPKRSKNSQFTRTEALRTLRGFRSTRAAIARTFCGRFARVAHQNRAIFAPNVCFHTAKRPQNSRRTRTEAVRTLRGFWSARAAIARTFCGRFAAKLRASRTKIASKSRDFHAKTSHSQRQTLHKLATHSRGIFANVF